MAIVNWVIVIAGVCGLGIAAYGLVAVALEARRRRRYLDIAVAAMAAVAAVALLLAFGDRIVR